jgi:hypothetical protein
VMIKRGGLLGVSVHILVRRMRTTSLQVEGYNC